jgi:ketosteroid isomerase-like protein
MAVGRHAWEGMMSMKTRLGLVAAGAALMLSACTPDEAPGREAAIEQILQADRDFAALAAEQGLAEAFGTYMDRVEGRKIGPSGDPVIGEADIRAAFANTPDGLLLDWTPVEAFASQAGDFGVSWGDWSIHSDGDRESVADARGRYITVWRRNAAGEWRGLLDTGSEDASYQPPPAEDDSPNAAGDH